MSTCEFKVMPHPPQYKTLSYSWGSPFYMGWSDYEEDKLEMFQLTDNIVADAFILDNIPLIERNSNISDGEGGGSIVTIVPWYQELMCFNGVMAVILHQKCIIFRLLIVVLLIHVC